MFFLFFMWEQDSGYSIYFHDTCKYRKTCKGKKVCTHRFKPPYVDGCLFDIHNIDLPGKVKYRPGYKKPELKIDRGCRAGRNYYDYEAYMEKHPDRVVVQMDSVILTDNGNPVTKVEFRVQNLSAAYKM